MKYKTIVLKSVLKNRTKKLVAVSIVLLISILLLVWFNPDPISHQDLELILGIPNVDSLNFIGILWFIYQLFVSICVTYLYLSYDFHNSYEFVKLRITFMKCWIQKLCIVLLFIFILRCIYFLIIFSLLHNYCTFSICDFILCTGIHLCSVIVVAFLSMLFMIFKVNIG